MSGPTDDIETSHRTERLPRPDLSLEAGSTAKQVSLVLYHPSGARTIVLALEKPVVIGRAEPSDVVIDDAGLSRQHARVTATEHGVWIEDLGSTNGTLVNGAPVPVARVTPEDEVSLGEVRAFVHVAAPPAHRAHGVDTHDRFFVALEDEVLRARTLSRPLSLVIFRALEKGRALQPGLRALAAKLRPIDRVAVYAPDIVEILLPEIDGERASILTRGLIEGRVLAAEVVAGVASFGPGAASADEMLERARTATRSATRELPVRQAEVEAESSRKSEPRVIVLDPKMHELFASAKRLAKSMVPVLIYGETGTGKEVLARALHEAGPRANARLKSINCGAIAPTLLESTLFGHERGAFTGADKRTPGIFEQAEGGTVFLDEVAELPVQAQIALLRVLENRTVTRLGGADEVPLDVRIIAATNRRLEPLTRDGKFRNDLFYRLNAATLEIPPLRERRAEIEPLARLFVEEGCRVNQLPLRELDPAAIALLVNHDWPGNIRELRNVIDHAVVSAESGVIGAEHLSARVRARAASEPRTIDSEPSLSFKDRVRRFETELILQALSRTQWNQSEAARLLRIPLRTLTNKLRTYGLRPNSGEESE